MVRRGALDQNEDEMTWAAFRPDLDTRQDFSFSPLVSKWVEAEEEVHLDSIKLHQITHTLIDVSSKNHSATSALSKMFLELLEVIGSISN